MRTLTAEQLAETLARHQKWLRREEGGERANLASANLVGANLASANLDGANLVGANLDGANLVGANLVGANLVGANLVGASLASANLVGANLASANLDGANLASANLAGANLDGASLDGANLDGANLAGASLDGASLDGASLAGATGVRAPIVPNIDAAILAAIEAPGCRLNMGNWHSCSTTHCRSGWAIHLAGEAGYALEDRIGPAAAGALIYAASRPGVPVPYFHATDAEALADMRAWAAKSTVA